MVTGFGDEDQVVDDGTSDGVFAEGEVVEEDHGEQVVVTPKKETLALPPQKAPAPPPSTKQEVANCFGFDSVSFFKMRISFKLSAKELFYLVGESFSRHFTVSPISPKKFSLSIIKSEHKMAEVYCLQCPVQFP